MASPISQKPRANIELILLGFLVSLILKGLLDHIYSAGIEHANGWRAIVGAILGAHPIEVLVFLFALLRFMYGAYRFHELGPPNAPTWRVCWDLVFTVLLFIGFYLAGLLIKFQPIQFYEVFALTHAVDLLWFLVPLARPRCRLFSAGGDACEVAARHFIVLDLLTLGVWGLVFACSGLFASAPTPAGLFYLLGPALIIIGVFDLWWNRTFYFHKIGSREQGTQTSSVAPTGTIYFAGPLFTQAEWRWNRDLAERLEVMGFKISLPQRIAREVLSENGTFDPDTIYLRNVAALDTALAVVAILDGADPDSGTSWECGYAHKAGKPVIGVRTDLRATGDDPRTATNLMLGRSCREVVQIPPQYRDDVEWVAREIVNAVKGLRLAE